MNYLYSRDATIIIHYEKLKIKHFLQINRSLAYPTDLSSIQRDYIKENFPEIMLTKSPKDIFEVINGIFYVAKTGCQWNMLPRSYPSWMTCYNFFRKWTDAGIFAKIPGGVLAVARQRLVIKPDATVVVVDSQSVRSGLP